ncbi:MAG: ribonuclease H family protein [Oribacterium sp.]|nr:ribonuclease H family protein [Oribacterium sp.]
MSKIYAVRNGRSTGLFNTWDECKAQVIGFKGAEYKSFTSETDAKAYLGNGSQPEVDTEAVMSDMPDAAAAKDNEIKDYLKKLSKGCDNVVAFVDGSFNSKTSKFGAGVILYDPLEDVIMTMEESGSGDASSMRNVAGEILASTIAMNYCLSRGDQVKSLDIYYDYSGIEMWSTGSWKTNNQHTKEYKAACDNARKSLTLNYHHVDGHSGVFGNEYVDMLAKRACGVTT